jgi:hypothetical protein
MKTSLPVSEVEGRKYYYKHELYFSCEFWLSIPKVGLKTKVQLFLFFHSGIQG